MPIAVTALNAELIDQQKLDNLADVSRYMPNVTLGDGQFTAGQLVAAIRGTNFSEVEKSFESSVGVIIDSMFLGTGTGASVQMLDVEQVEVLRGPQGTLYGRNTIAAGIIPEERPAITTCDIFGLVEPSTCRSGNYKVQSADGFETALRRQALSLRELHGKLDRHPRAQLGYRRRRAPGRRRGCGPVLVRPAGR